MHRECAAVAAAEFDTVDHRISADCEVRRLAESIEVCERGIPAKVANRVDGTDCDAGSAVEVKQVVMMGDAG
jgi:hypothetical protein